jgi:23S rRNA (uridine2552-2'-O)-methyltransferase
MSRPGSRNELSGRNLKVKVKTGKGRTVSQKIWLERQLNDPYVIEAKKLGYRARSAFKLIEIDDKYKFLKPGQVVVDLGAAPGGWSQVADSLVGVTIFKKDFLDEDAPRLLFDAIGGAKVHVVLSDMAAHATGHRQTDHLLIMSLAEAGLDFAMQVLEQGGVYLAKVLRGGSEGEMLKVMKKNFASVRHLKPMSSRDDSAELFVLAMGFRG